MKTLQTPKNGTVTGQTNRSDKSGRTAKTHADYWRSRILRRTFLDRSGQTCTSPEYSVRMRLNGRDTYFNLATPIQAAAADKARDIYVFLLANGWAATLAKFKPRNEVSTRSVTLGEFLAEVERVCPLRPKTLRNYATKLRRIAAEVGRVDAKARGREKRRKYDYHNGGHAEWVARVDGLRLDLLTPESVMAWRNSRAANAGSNPVLRKSAERTAASCLRCARALFAPRITRLLKLVLPPNPFAGVPLGDPGPTRYRSEVSPEWLLVCANRELRLAQPQLFLALFLCLWAGLRRKEADLLMWEQVDLDAAQINVCRTKYFEPKTEESQRQIDLPAEAVAVLRTFKSGGSSEFVLEGAEPRPEATYDYYRCDCTWRNLNAWLRSKGISQTKAIHALRKESGSLIASAFGIEAARQHLGHRDIRTTSAHYVAKKKRIEVPLSLTEVGQLAAVG